MIFCLCGKLIFADFEFARIYRVENLQSLVFRMAPGKARFGASACCMLAQSNVRSRRTVFIRLMSAAGTGFYYTAKRVRGKEKLNLVKYDPVGACCTGLSAFALLIDFNSLQSSSTCSSRRPRSNNVCLLCAAAASVLHSPNKSAHAKAK